MANMKVVLLLLSVSSVFSVMPGGWEEGSVDDNTAKGLALSAPVELDQKSNSMNRHRLIKLVRVETQVVAGMKYRLTLEIGETDCPKNKPVADLDECSLQNTQTCVATYWIQPWLLPSFAKTPNSLEGIECHPKTQSTPQPATTTSNQVPLLGRKDDIEPKSDDSARIAKFAVDQLNHQSNSLRMLVLTDIRKASKQVSVCSVEVQERAWMSQQLQLLAHKCAVVSTDSPLRITKPSRSQVTNMSQRPVLGGDGHDIGNYGTFQEFKEKYNKQYRDRDEEMKRFKVFRKNMKSAQKLQRKEKGSARYGATQFADLTTKEFRKFYLTPKWDVSVADSMDKAEIPESSTVPASWDWRDHKAVTEVKNQGQCGSCWAFSTTGNIEGQWALKKQQLISLSEQELVDCDKVDQGCNGGLPANAYKAIEKLGGLETEKQYPYEAEGEKCAFKKSNAKVYINSSVSISSDEDDMKAWLYHNGPISIGINANAMQYYMGGVSHPWSFFCNPDNLDHGVLIVGYGTQKGWFGDEPYWIVKNSWGPSWGEKGYYLVYRGGGVCGLNKMPTSAVVN